MIRRRKRGRRRVESQTHIRVFVRDKALLNRFMKRYGIMSQAQAFRKILLKVRR